MKESAQPLPYASVQAAATAARATADSPPAPAPALRSIAVGCRGILTWARPLDRPRAACGALWLSPETLYRAGCRAWWVWHCRAYKLGKQKCSYNQVELHFTQDPSPSSGGGTPAAHPGLALVEAVEMPGGVGFVDPRLQDSCLRYNLRFQDERRMRVMVFLVHAHPCGKSSQAGEPGQGQGQPLYQWLPVTREQCTKGCKGPLIRGLQRFGRLSRRSLSQCSPSMSGQAGETPLKLTPSQNPTPSPLPPSPIHALPASSPAPAGTSGTPGGTPGGSGSGLGTPAGGSSNAEGWKEPRHLYIAIDEASTHVIGPAYHGTTKFRLLLAFYSDREQFLGTALSTGIKVVANNDAPRGAASIQVPCHLPGLDSVDLRPLERNRTPLRGKGPACMLPP